MVVEGSVTGIVKIGLIILGALVLLRFFGRLMIAKRNMEEERMMNQRSRKINNERAEKLRNFGKVNVINPNSNRTSKSNKSNDIEDADFEEIH